MPSSSTYLQQFDAQSSLWIWDEELIVENNSGGYVEVRSAFGGDGTIPSPVNSGWDSLSEVQGLRGATAIFQVSFVCCACVCARGRE
jgi:hypothetical protein